MFHQFDHRWRGFSECGEESVDVDRTEPSAFAMPRFWISALDASTKLVALPTNWHVAVREVTNATNERTCIAAILPKYAVGHNAQVFRFAEAVSLGSALLSNLNAIVFDFATRTKVGGSHLSSFVLRQLPLLPAARWSVRCEWRTTSTMERWITPRSLELTYTAWDLEPFSRDCGYEGPPFRWDEERRFWLRCELDAAFFHL